MSMAQPIMGASSFPVTSMTVRTPMSSVPAIWTLKFASRSVLASFLTVW